MSQPYIVALKAQTAELKADDRVLEIGTGSGYAAALMNLLCCRVFTVERHAALATVARRNLDGQSFADVEVRVGDGTLGWPEAAPFNAIIVAAGSPAVPKALKRQLAVDGRLVIPVGDRGGQRLIKVTRDAEDAYREEDLGGVLFVPLVGREGWIETHAF